MRALLLRDCAHRRKDLKCEASSGVASVRRRRTCERRSPELRVGIGALLRGGFSHRRTAVICGLFSCESVLIGAQTLNVGRPPAKPPFAGGQQSHLPPRTKFQQNACLSTKKGRPQIEAAPSSCILLIALNLLLCNIPYRSALPYSSLYRQRSGLPNRSAPL